MIIDKIKNLFRQDRKYQKEQISLLKELNWANVYHDSIRGKDWIEKLPLKIGRWAGSYSFFYVLNRVLDDCRPKTIIEFGLGESSKFINAYLNNILLDSKHLIIEHDTKWESAYLSNNQLSSRTRIEICHIEEKEINGFKSISYKGITSKIKDNYDLYIIDGPFGSERFSRYDIVNLAKNFVETSEFIIILDDYNRKGEQDTAKALLSVLEQKEINFHTKNFDGCKSLLVIVTEKYKYITSI